MVERSHAEQRADRAAEEAKADQYCLGSTPLRTLCLDLVPAVKEERDDGHDEKKRSVDQKYIFLHRNLLLFDDSIITNQICQVNIFFQIYSHISLLFSKKAANRR